MKNLPTFCVTAFISVFTLCAAIHAADVFQNFNGGGGQTSYSTSRLPGGCGEMDGFFRLLNIDGGQSPILYFENYGYADNFISVSFDLRNSPASGFADGVCFSLVNTAAYSDFPGLYLGEGASPDDSLSWTFRVYNANEAMLRWNNNAVTIGPVNNDIIKNSQFFTANLSLNFGSSEGVDGAWVYATMMNKATGEIVAMANQFVPGLEPFTSNVAFGGRTGGESMNADLDNIRVLYNSEDYIRWIPDTNDRLTDNAPWEGGAAPVRNSGQTGQIYAGTNVIHNADGINGWNLLVTGGNTTITDGSGDGGLRMSDNGTLTMEGGKFTSVGKTVVQHGASVTINAGQFYTNGMNVLGDNGPATVTVNGGLYEVGNFDTFIAYQPWSGSSSVIVNDGVAKFGGRLVIGQGATGTLDIRGGAVFTRNVDMGAREGGGPATGILNISGGQMTVDGTFLANTGADSTANINLTGGSMRVNGDFRTNVAANRVVEIDGESVTLPANTVTNMSLSGGANLTITGGFTPMVNPDHSNRFKLEMNNATLTINGHFWGGDPGPNSTPFAGEGYMAEFYFGPGSTVVAGGEAWIGMNAKTYIRIEDGASITSRDNNSGIGWAGGDKTAGAGSVLDMWGGEFNAVNFNVGEGVAVTMNQSGGTVNAGNEFRVRNGSKMNLSDGKVNVTNELLLNNGSTELNMTGGEINAGSLRINNWAAMNLSGGTLNVRGDLYTTDNGAFHFDGGTLNARNITFDLVQNDGILSPGGNGVIGITEIGSAESPKNYILNDGTIRLDLNLLNDTSDLLTVYGDVFFGPNVFLDLVYDMNLLANTGEHSFKIMELFSPNTEFTNDEIASLLSAQNAYFWIVSQDGSGGVWLTLDTDAVPEPGTWAMLMLGGVALGFAARRKYQKKA